jgi:UDP-N-acetylglucosamine--N-acetylmuramyl-(pentapeptide) pyrophosphoryl-undecaprenol N-acetylglucosamine transferase
MMAKKRKIILATGGTGGHVFPALALAEKIAKSNLYTPVFFCDKRGHSYLRKQKVGEVIETLNYEPTTGVLGRISFLNALLWSLLRSLWLVLRLRPKAIIGFGGYASFSPVLSAVILGKKLYLQEQNSVMGKVNRWFAIYAKKIFTSFPAVKKIPIKALKKVKFTGLPVREEIVNMAAEKHYSKKSAFRVLVIGGSQGAEVLTDIVAKAIDMLPEEVQEGMVLRHQVRKNRVKDIQFFYGEETQLKAFDVRSFYEDIAGEIHKSDLVISRAGSSALAEIMCLSKAAILVPYVFAADDHQSLNAEYLGDNKAALVIKQEDLNAEMLAEQIITFFDHREILEKMARRAGKLYQKDCVEHMYQHIVKNSGKR